MKTTIALLAIFVAGFFYLRPTPFDWRVRDDLRQWSCADLPPPTDPGPQTAVQRQMCFRIGIDLGLK